MKRRSRELSQLFQSYQPYDHKLGQRQTVLVTEESHDHVHLVAHNKYYDQVCSSSSPPPPLPVTVVDSPNELFVTGTGQEGGGSNGKDV